MSLHFAYGRSTLSSSDWDITVNTGGGDLTGASKYFSLQAQNPVGKNLILVSSLVVFQTGDSITFTINDTALTEAEGWTHYVIGISDTSTPSTFNQIARINIYDMSTGAVDFNTQNTFPLDLTITKDEQLNTGVFVDDKLSLPVADLLYGMRRGVTENNYIYEYNPFSTLTPNNDDVLSGTGGVWLKKEEFTNYIASVSQYGGCGYDIYHLTNFSQVELPTYNADGTNSFRVKYYLLNNSGFTLQPGTGFTLAAQIGGVERTELFDGKISYRFNGIVTPTTGTLRKVNSVTGQTLDFIDTDFVYTKANPVTISKDYIEHNTGIYFDVHVNFLSLEFNNLLPEGYLQIFFSYISPKGVFTPVGTLFEKGIIFNKYNKRRVLADTGLNVVVGEGEGLIKNFAWYSCNTSISGLAANTANQKLYVNINGVVFVDIAERTSSILRAVVDTTAKESIASPWSAYSAVSLNSALVVTVDYDCDSDLNLQIRDTYPDVIAGDWGIFNPTKLTIYVQRQSDGQIRKFTNFIPAGSNPSQNFTITDWSVGTVVGSVPSTSASFFDPITNSFSTTLGAGNFAADSYRVAHTYVWNGDTVSDISHSVALGCVTESQINGEEVFGITNYGTISEIKDITELYDGKSLYCNATDQNYFYDANSTETEDNYFVLEPTSGVGRWLSVAKGTVRLFKGAVAPTISNDISEGYLIGDKWLDTVEEKEYTLVDNTDGAAVWKQVGGGANENIILSADVTWYVSPTGDANADGLTVGTPITLEEAADRVFTVVPTGKYYTITIELADGTYNYANDYRFVHPDTLFSFDIKLHGADWVGLTAYPTVDISNRQIYFKNFQGYSYIENVYYGTLRLVGSSFDIKNVATTNICRITEYYGYAYVNGFYKFGGVATYAFYITGGYLDLDGVTFDAGGTTRNFTQGFIRIGYTGGLSLSSPNTITGTFTGKKIDFINAEAILDGDEANFATIPGDIEPVYPTYIFAPSNTLATTAFVQQEIADINTSVDITVTVASGEFRFNGVELTDGLLLVPGNTYVFDLSDASNATHTLAFSTTLDGTHNAGSAYMTGVTTTGTPGTDGILTFNVPLNAPETLYPYCSNHALMGGSTVFNTKGGGASAANEVTVDASGFNGNLSVTDTTVQTALETIDGLTFSPNIVSRGSWNSGTSYLVNDVVHYTDGNTYIANTANTNKTPGTDPEWHLFAEKGEPGAQGEQGVQGIQGNPGNAATITVGTVTTGSPGSNVIVTNSGTSSAAVLDFTIPQGATGATGSQGLQGIQGVQGDPGLKADVTRTSSTSNTIGTGSKSFTFDTASSNLGWLVGTRLRATATAGNFMSGVVTAVSTTEVTINVDYILGSGTYTSWNISIAGEIGATGSVSSASSLILAQIATPSAPSTGNTLIYAKNDGKVYKRAAGGSEEEVGSGFAGTVSDSTFRIQDNTDATKQIAFEASGITTGTTRTLTAPNASGTIALTSDLFTLVSTKTTTYTANNKEEIPCNTITTGAFTITTPASGEFAVFDVGGTTPTTGFGVNNLTITPASGTIMGTTSYVLDVGAVRRRFILVGTDWRVA